MAASFRNGVPERKPKLSQLWQSVLAKSARVATRIRFAQPMSNAKVAVVKAEPLPMPGYGCLLGTAGGGMVSGEAYCKSVGRFSFLGL